MPPTIGRRSPSDETALRTEHCLDLVGRVCFGHLAFSRGRHIDVLPVRYALEDGWVFFRADFDLRHWIARSPWLCLSVTEIRDSAHASVVVRGGCYAAEDTGSAAGDSSAQRGIVALRDRARVGPMTTRRRKRTLGIFRLRVEEVRGTVTVVPCPAGRRPYDEGELAYLRTASRTHSQSDDSRADDDGMAEPDPATVLTPDSSARTR